MAVLLVNRKQIKTLTFLFSYAIIPYEHKKQLFPKKMKKQLIQFDFSKWKEFFSACKSRLPKFDTNIFVIVTIMVCTIPFCFFTPPNHLNDKKVISGKTVFELKEEIGTNVIKDSTILDSENNFKD